MRIAVASCFNYRDAWQPFEKLFHKFWPRHPYTSWLSDRWDGRITALDGFQVFGDLPWCKIVSDYASLDSEPLLLLQEDFFLNHPVNEDLIEHGLRLLEDRDLGAVRLYPCPGATDTSDDPYFGPVAKGTRYRNSIQATIWKPAYLKAIAERYKTPTEFENQGSPWASANRPEEVWAFKREVQPWPISYICSAISRGKWEPAALEFCKQQGIEVDLSLRPVA